MTVGSSGVAARSLTAPQSREGEALLFGVSCWRLASADPHFTHQLGKPMLTQQPPEGTKRSARKALPPDLTAVIGCTAVRMLQDGAAPDDPHLAQLQALWDKRVWQMLRLLTNNCCSGPGRGKRRCGIDRGRWLGIPVSLFVSFLLVCVACNEGLFGG